jgi:tripartite-type tricarboxylate transporter receptor subunit TctC
MRSSGSIWRNLAYDDALWIYHKIELVFMPRKDVGNGSSRPRITTHLKAAPMTVLRRQFLKMTAAAGALLVLRHTANAEAYPSRPVRIIVGFAPGGAADIVARLIAERLSQRTGQRFIVENRQGAGTNVATEMVVGATPDGYTLLLITGANANNATLYSDLNFNFIRDIAPIGMVDHLPLVMVVHPSVPSATVPEFVAYAKANPGKIAMGSGGNGSPIHMAEELFMMMTGTEMVHVPYRGEALALTDLLGGRLQVVFGSPAATAGYVKSGRVRALAVTSATRSEALPDIPTVAEFVPGYEASAWHGIGAPKKTPAAIVDKLNAEISAALTDPAMKSRLAELGANVLGGSPSDFGNFIARETEKWAKVIKFAGIKAE